MCVCLCVRACLRAYVGGGGVQCLEHARSDSTASVPGPADRFVRCRVDWTDNRTDIRTDFRTDNRTDIRTDFRTDNQTDNRGPMGLWPGARRPDRSAGSPAAQGRLAAVAAPRLASIGSGPRARLPRTDGPARLTALSGAGLRAGLVLSPGHTGRQPASDRPSGAVRLTRPSRTGRQSQSDGCNLTGVRNDSAGPGWLGQTDRRTEMEKEEKEERKMRARSGARKWRGRPGGGTGDREEEGRVAEGKRKGGDWREEAQRDRGWREDFLRATWNGGVGLPQSCGAGGWALQTSKKAGGQAGGTANTDPAVWPGMWPGMGAGAGGAGGARGRVVVGGKASGGAGDGQQGRRAPRRACARARVRARARAWVRARVRACV